MTIAIDIRSLSGGAYTGVGEYTRNLLRHMIRAAPGIQFKLFFNAHSQHPDLSFLDDAQNIQTYFFRYPNKYFSTTTRFFNRPKLDTLVAGCDVFFSPHFISAPVSAGCKKIVTFHDLSFKRYPEFFDMKRKLWHFSNNPKKQAQEADRVIAVSESTAWDLTDIYSVDSDRVRVVYSGISEEFSKEHTREELWHVRAKYKLPERFILSLSTIEPRKNVLGTVRAFELFKESNRTGSDPVRLDIKLVIAGRPGWLYKETFKAIKKSKWRDDIQYIDFVQDEDKPALYKLAELFVYPSIYEGFGFPALEAMAAGTPVITSACSSLPEVVEDAALLVDPFNVSDIAWMMEEVIRDRALASFLREKGLAQAQKFSWQKCAQETLDILTF